MSIVCVTGFLQDIRLTCGRRWLITACGRHFVRTATMRSTKSTLRKPLKCCLGFQNSGSGIYFAQVPLGPPLQVVPCNAVAYKFLRQPESSKLPPSGKAIQIHSLSQRGDRINPEERLAGPMPRSLSNWRNRITRRWPRYGGQSAAMTPLQSGSRAITLNCRASAMASFV
jgi:hypothetical protein